MLRGGKRYGRMAAAAIWLAALLAGAIAGFRATGRLWRASLDNPWPSGRLGARSAGGAGESGRQGRGHDCRRSRRSKAPELELPSRALRSQSGYEQLTVTVTDQGGRYVTGLQKGDFRIYVDGIQRPLEFLRRDTNTPVSVGILVDTSGSMEPKIPQARAAIAQFIRELNPNDDIFLYAFSDQQFLLQPLRPIMAW